MIYLINVTYYNKDTKEIIDLLKIGFTDNWKARQSQYFLHNPNIKILHLIEEGTEEHEKKLHFKFNKYKYPDYGNEWFYYDQSIIDYIKSATIEELNELPENPEFDFKRVLKGKKFAKRILSYVISEIDIKKIEDIVNEMYSKIGKNIMSKDNVVNYLKTILLIDETKINEFFEMEKNQKHGIYCKDERINNQVCEFFETYNTLNFLYDKLKELCKFSVTPGNEEATKIILNQWPNTDEVKLYFTKIGPKRLIQLGYSITRIKKELGIIEFSQELLIDTIYSRFHVGDKFTLSELKTILSDLYTSIKYVKCPKAKDIEDYFEVKLCSIYEKIPEGRRKITCYELLSSYESKLREELAKWNKQPNE